MKETLPHNSEIAKRMHSMEESIRFASATLIEMQNKNLNIQTKSNALDLVTQADLASEKILTDSVRRNFPNDHILAEEESSAKGSIDSGTADFCWVIDPLDGTVNYSHGLPLFAISIGLLYQQRAVMGMIDLPVFRWSYRAIAGEGALKNGEPIHVSLQSDPSKALVVTGFPYSRHRFLSFLTQGVYAMLNSAGGLRRTGTAALDLCWLAEGKFDAYYEYHLKPWDTTAGMVILKEAGGEITGIDGNSYNPLTSNSLMASNSLIQKWLLDTIGTIQDRPDHLT